MSTASLPSYAAPLLERTPTYTAEPQAFEQRLALNRLRPRPSGEFTKQSKSGALALRLFAQDNNASLPVYGAGALIDGAVEIARPEGVNSVEVKVRPGLVVTQRLLKNFLDQGHTAAQGDRRGRHRYSRPRPHPCASVEQRPRRGPLPDLPALQPEPPCDLQRRTRRLCACNALISAESQGY